MYVTFKNEAASKTGDAATAKLAVNIDFHWYNNDVSSVSAVDPGKVFSWELQIYSPYEANYFNVLRDGWAGDLKVFSPAAIVSQADTITVKWIDDSITTNATNNYYSLDDIAYKNTVDTDVKRDQDVETVATVKDGCINDLVKKTPATTDMCTEKWEFIDTATKAIKVKCVRASLDIERPFTVASTPA